MRNKGIQIYFAALLAFIALPLAACINEGSPTSAKPAAPQTTTYAPAASPETIIASGSPEMDWRKVDAFSTGTITQDIRVLYLFEGSRLALYHDAPQKLPVLTLDLSALESPNYSTETLAIADKNDDGYNDLILPLQNAGSLIYLWDMDANAFSRNPLAPQGLWLTIGDWPKQAVYHRGRKMCRASPAIPGT